MRSQLPPRYQINTMVIEFQHTPESKFKLSAQENMRTIPVGKPLIEVRQQSPSDAVVENAQPVIVSKTNWSYCVTSLRDYVLLTGFNCYFGSILISAIKAPPANMVPILLYPCAGVFSARLAYLLMKNFGDRWVANGYVNDLRASYARLDEQNGVLRFDLGTGRIVVPAEVVFRLGPNREHLPVPQNEPEENKPALSFCRLVGTNLLLTFISTLSCLFIERLTDAKTLRADVAFTALASFAGAVLMTFVAYCYHTCRATPEAAPNQGGMQLAL